MNYKGWAEAIPEVVKGDSLWKMVAYRLALFTGDIGWSDACKLMQDQRTIGLSNQLYQALGSISANLAEGYSRGTGKDRARFYEYALGSARESRDWYFKSRYILDGTIINHRLGLLSEIIRLLLIMIPQQHGRSIREENSLYEVNSDNSQTNLLANNYALADLLNNIPFSDT